MSKHRLWIVATVLFLLLPCVWADVLAVDRGLPATNLNNGAGADRSNVDWASTTNGGFLGDDFTLSGSGTYTISTLRIWFDECQGGPCDLTATHSSVTLYGSVAGTPLTQLATGSFTGGAGVSNPDITVTPVVYPGSTGQTQYQAQSGLGWQLWQLDFNNLNWVVQGGQIIQFGVLGLGPAPFFLEASNAADGGVPADGADGKYREFNTNDLSSVTLIDSLGNGWDKSSDINVQVLTTPEPGSWSLLGAVIGGLALARRRRR